MLAGTTPAVGRCAISYGHALYSWALKEGIMEMNPFKNLPMPGLKSRERVLSDEELAAVWRAADVASDPFGKVVQVLTGWIEVLPRCSKQSLKIVRRNARCGRQ
jgi:hypothetical protein